MIFFSPTESLSPHLFGGMAFFLSPHCLVVRAFFFSLPIVGWYGISFPTNSLSPFVWGHGILLPGPYETVALMVHSDTLNTHVNTKQSKRFPPDSKQVEDRSALETMISRYVGRLLSCAPKLFPRVCSFPTPPTIQVFYSVLIFQDKAHFEA